MDEVSETWLALYYLVGHSFFKRRRDSFRFLLFFLFKILYVIVLWRRDYYVAKLLAI